MKSSVQMDYRCNCGKLLFRGLVFHSSVEAKCPRCNKLNFIEGLGMVHNSGRAEILATAKGKMVKVSPSVEAVLGYQPEELLGESVNMIFASDRVTEADEVFAKKIMENKYLRMDADLRQKGGQIIPASVCYRHFMINGGELFLRVIDVEPEVNQHLLDEAQFSDDYFCDVVTETDEKGILLYLDRNLEKITGLRPEDLVGTKVADLLFGDQREMRLKNYRMLLGKKKPYRTIPDFQVRGKGGEIYVQEVYCMPFYDDAGNFVGFRNMHWLRKLPVDKS